MRTTVTLDEDVARRLKDSCRARGVPFKQVVNEALRRGLDQMEGPSPMSERFRVVPWDLGECSLSHLDGIDEVLNYAEGDNRR